jgi:hypothetical protein
MSRFMALPIATTEQFKAALLSMRDADLPDSYLMMLRSQCRSAEGTITSTKLAEAAGYKNYNAANLHYGTLGRGIAERLGYNPPERADGSGMWWTTLSYSSEDVSEAETGHFQFIMRPELVAALRSMHWA